MDFFNNPDNPEEMMEQLLTITTIHGVQEHIQTGEKIVLFQCEGTGLYFPGDYLEMWGRKYGLGLGPKPISECLETAWHKKIAYPEDLKTVEQIMYPLMNGGHDIGAVILSPKDVAKCPMAVLGINDPFIVKRGKILRQKQLENKNGLLKQIIYQGRQTK